jgi:murein DD-endopeptidase MepM/ murein hydrolase activator NlpD
VIAIAGLARRLFAERQIDIRSTGGTRRLTISGVWVFLALALAVVGLSALGQLIVGYLDADRLAADKQEQAAQAEMSNSDLRHLIRSLQQRLAAADRDAELARSRLAATTAQNAALRSELAATELRLRAIDFTQSELQTERTAALARLTGAEELLAAKTAQIAQMSQNVDAATADLRQTEQQRAGLVARLHQLQAELTDATNESVQYKSSWASAEHKFQQLVAEREKVIAERDGLLGRLAVLQQPSQERIRKTKVAAVEPTSEPIEAVAASSGQLGDLAGETRRGWSEVVTLLSSAGVDLDRLAARFGAVPPGQGGPFVALNIARQRNQAEPGEMPEALRKALRSLPLSAPLESYHMESRFGIRIDPFNHRQAMHPGLDLAAPFRSPVFATAPGTVIFAGPKGEYGKVVEIDHGSGIVTRYAHLHRIMVAVGQRLGAREQIGQLGSSGRSSGPHVHYEVLVNGTAQDPEKFLQAGKGIVQVSQQ